jgi:hypothetical protein
MKTTVAGGEKSVQTFQSPWTHVMKCDTPRNRLINRVRAVYTYIENLFLRSSKYYSESKETPQAKRAFQQGSIYYKIVPRLWDSIQTNVICRGKYTKKGKRKSDKLQK